MSGLVGGIGARSGLLKPDAESFHTTSLSDSWLNWDLTNNVTSDDGLRVQRYGKIYVVNLSCYKTGMSTGVFSSTIRTLTNSDITLPKSSVYMGCLTSYVGTAEDDKVGLCYLGSGGDLQIYGNNGAGTTFHLIGNFIGVDQG